MAVGLRRRGAKETWHSFGTLAETPLDEARAKAIALLNDVREGVDLEDRKRQQRRAEHSAYHSGKLTDAVDTYLNQKSDGTRYWLETRRTFDSDVVPLIGTDTLICNVTRKDIRHVVETKQAKSPGAARTLFAALRPFFKWCVERELISVSPTDGITPPKTLPSRDRVLSDTELSLVWKATLQTEYPFGPFYRLLILTAQRREEVAAIRWSELDLDACTWIIPKERTKNNKEHLVHLSPQAVEVLTSIQKQTDDEGNESPFVFTTTKTTPISGYSRAKRELDDLISPDLGRPNINKPWRVHDLRRTAATGMASLGIPPHIVERVLNHISGSTGGLVGVYQRFEYQEERKKAILAWGSYVQRLVTPMSTSSVVIPFRSTDLRSI